MPLSEFFRLARGNLELTKQKEAAGSTDLPTIPNNQLADLSLGNDQISVQGHSAKDGSTSSSHNEQFNNSNFQNSVLSNTTNSILERVEVFDDFPTFVSSVGVGIGKDDDMTPWLSYSIHDSLQKDHSNPLTELPLFTLNDTLKRNSSFDKINSLDLMISSATSISSDMRSRSAHIQSFPFKSGSEIISTGNTGTTKSRALVLPSIRVQKQDSGIESSNTTFVNFSHSRPSSNDRPTYIRSTLATLVTNPSDMTNDISTPDQPTLRPLNDRPKPAATMPLEGSGTAEKSEALHRENAVKGKRVIEPIVAFISVSSESSVDGISDNPSQSLKRKSRESDEHEGLIEDLQDEFAGAGKSGPTKGSKRGRVAEVHNLSERRRRDKINEKMRALQELIPNCNKVDKASMLDEAIEYTKTLQLQLQITSMGAGLCVSPMMLTPQMQQMQDTQMPLFAPMGMGFGLGLDPMAHVPLLQGAYLPGPSFQPVAWPWSFQPMVGPSFSSLGHTFQGLSLAPCVNTSRGDAEASGAEKPKVIQYQPTVNGSKESNLAVKHDRSADTNS